MTSTTTTSTHSHTHAGGDHHHHALPPSGEGTVVLDIGGAVGALVVHTPERFAGREIEIARRGETQQFVHTEVRERHLPDGLVYAGGVRRAARGRLHAARRATRSRGDVEIRSGRVTEVDWSLG